MTLPTPPEAAKEPQSTKIHGVTLSDPYNWLRDPGYPEVSDKRVLNHLTAENAYFEAVMAPHKAFTEELFEELKARIKEDDSSVPVKDGDFLYQWRFDKGAQYRKWFRWRDGTAANGQGPETLLIDEPDLAEGKGYFQLRDLEVSPDETLVAYTTDTDGSERFTIRIKEAETGKVLDDTIGNTNGVVAWAADSRTLLYVELNENLRPFRVRAHALGGDPAKDPVIYEESDSSFFVGIDRTQSRRFLVIASGDHVTSELRVLEARTPLEPPRLIAEREREHEYDLEHAGDRFFIRTNDKHKNFRVVVAPLDAPGRENWQELIAPDDRHYLQDLTCFGGFMVIEERVDGLDQVRIRAYTGEEHSVQFPEAAYAAGLGNNPEFDSPKLRIGYTSMVTPATVYDYDPETRELITLKVQEIPSGYDKARYRTERLMAPAPDGTLIPVSIVYREDFAKDGEGRLHLYGYGAYGLGMSPAFSTSRLSLLDRGFAYAIAHIRGGDELGYHWYEAGKLMNRRNTFGDFIACAEFLIAEGYSAKGRISISGGSAGGSLMGVVANERPDLWGAVVADVPFVDVLNTMLDDSLPLTPIEWPEWGNPKTDKAAFDYILGYSPYENVAAQAYPPILITAGLSDPRVTYWEPAKWAARLRATKTDDNLLLLKTNMGAGHGGKSGRFESLYEVAEAYTFILKAFGRV